MRRIIFIIAFLFLSAVPAYSFETPATDAVERRQLGEVGAVFQKVADKFNCITFAWGNFLTPNHNLIQLEYVPDGDDVKDWKRLVTVTVYTLPGSAAADMQILNNIIGSVMERFKQRATIIRQELYTEKKTNEPMLFIEYRTGEGAQQEHNAAIFRRMGGKAAAFVQIQSRGKPLDPADSDAVRKMVDGGK